MLLICSSAVFISPVFSSVSCCAGRVRRGIGLAAVVFLSVALPRLGLCCVAWQCEVLMWWSLCCCVALPWFILSYVVLCLAALMMSGCNCVMFIIIFHFVGVS